MAVQSSTAYPKFLQGTPCSWAILDPNFLTSPLSLLSQYELIIAEHCKKHTKQLLLGSKRRPQWDFCTNEVSLQNFLQENKAKMLLLKHTNLLVANRKSNEVSPRNFLQDKKAKMLLPEAHKSGRVTRTERRFGRGKAARTDGRRRRTWRGPIGRGKRRAAGRRTAPRSRGAWSTARRRGPARRCPSRARSWRRSSPGRAPRTRLPERAPAAHPGPPPGSPASPASPAPRCRHRRRLSEAARRRARGRAGPLAAARGVGGGGGPAWSPSLEKNGGGGRRGG